MCKETRHHTESWESKGSVSHKKTPRKEWDTEWESCEIKRSAETELLQYLARFRKIRSENLPTSCSTEGDAHRASAGVWRRERRGHTHSSPKELARLLRQLKQDDPPTPTPSPLNIPLLHQACLLDEWQLQFPPHATLILPKMSLQRLTLFCMTTFERTQTHTGLGGIIALKCLSHLSVPIRECLSFTGQLWTP